MPNAMNTYSTTLVVKKEGSWVKLVDIKDYPDLQSEPESLDTTTLSDSATTHIMGIEQTPDTYTFTANYTKANFGAVQAYEGEEIEMGLLFGDGETLDANGAFYWKGYVRAGIAGGGVDEVRNMNIYVVASTPIYTSEDELDGE